MSFQQGLSGLSAAATALNVIGNNVANASTVGFKGANAHFADVFAASLGIVGASQVGIGVGVSAIQQQFTQGNLTRIALPMFVRNVEPKNSQQGLQRFEVDSAARTLKVKGLLGAVTTEWEDLSDPLWWQRSVQIGPKLHWLTRSQVTSVDW